MKQNLLAQTLSANCYEKDPSFLRYRQEFKLPFEQHEHFKKNDIVKRQKLSKNKREYGA